MRVRKFPLFILVAMLVFQSAVYAIGEGWDDQMEEPFGSEAPIIIEEDAPEEMELLDVSPIDPSFYENREGALVASPLTIYNEDMSSERERMRAYLPAKYDLRDERRTTPVRDQGPNGSCWAFATYGSLESTMTKYGYYDFSEKHLRNTHGFDWGPNDGGNRDISAAYLARWSGPIWEKDDPYSPYGFTSPSGLQRAFDLEKVYFIPDIKNNNTTTMKQYLMEYGAMYTTVDGGQNYDSKTYNSHYDGGYGRGNHAVTIIGWDDNFSRYNFRTTAPGNGAWIVKNSWGTSFLANGYYYVSYYDGVMGNSNAQYFAKRKDTSGRIYQYDPLGATRSVGYRGSGYMANIYKADRNETLHQVGLFNVANNTSYKIYLVRNVNSTSDLTNKRVEIASGNFNIPGYYTVDTKKYSLRSGEQFAIVVYMSNSSYSYPLAIESPIRNFSSKAYASRGQSFISSTGSSWKDLTSERANSNCCIKAITTTGTAPTPDPDPDPDPNPTPDPDDEDPIEPIEPEEPEDIKVTGVTLNYTSGWIYKGRYGQLKATVSPSNATNKEVKWYTSNSRVCTVTQSGRIYGVYPGTATISVYTMDGYYKATCRVTVKDPGYYYYDDGDGDKIDDEDNPYPDPDPEIEITEIEIVDGAEAYLPIDKKAILETRIYPEDATNKNLNVFPATGGYVCTASKGELIPIKTGKEIIKVTSATGKAEASITVHIVEPGESVPGLPLLTITGDNPNYNPDDEEPEPDPEPQDIDVREVRISPSSRIVFKGATFNLASMTTITPMNATDKTLRFESSNPAIASVDAEGNVTALEPGKVRIKAIAHNGRTGYMDLEVKLNAEDWVVEDILLDLPTRRSWGVFEIGFTLKTNYPDYSGSGKLVLKGSNGKTYERTVYFSKGKASVRFTGFDIYVGVKKFTGSITVANKVKNFELNLK